MGNDEPLVLRLRIKELEQWVEDLQSGMYVNCVYCGHRYGPRDEVPVAMAEALREHVEICPAHPASILKGRVSELEGEVGFYRDKWRAARRELRGREKR